MADKQNVGKIEVTADVDLSPLNSKLEELKEILKTVEDRKFTVTGDLKGKFFTDLDKAVQKIAAGAKAPVQLDAAQNASAKLQEQLDKVTNLEATVARFDIAKDAAAPIQAYLDKQKFVATISEFQINEENLVSQIQTALTGKKFTIDVEMGDVEGSPRKGSASAKAAAATPAGPAGKTPDIEKIAKQFGVDPAKLAAQIAKAVSTALGTPAPASADAKAASTTPRVPVTEQPVGTARSLPRHVGLDTTITETGAGSTRLRPDVSSQALWAGRTWQPIRYLATTPRYGDPRGPLPRGTRAEHTPVGGGVASRFRGAGAPMGPDEPVQGPYIPGTAPAPRGAVTPQLLRYDLPRQMPPQEPQRFYFSKKMATGLQAEGRGDITEFLGSIGVKPGQMVGKEASFQLGRLLTLERMDDAKGDALRSVYESLYQPYGRNRRETFEVGARTINRKGAGNTLMTPTDIGVNAASSSLARQRTAATSMVDPAMRMMEGVQFDNDLAEQIGDLTTGRNPAVPADFQQARRLLGSRWRELREAVRSTGQSWGEFRSGIENALDMLDPSEVENYTTEVGPLEKEAIQIGRLFSVLDTATERRTGRGGTGRGGKIAHTGSMLGRHEEGVVTPGWIIQDLERAHAAFEREQFAGEEAPAQPPTEEERAASRKTVRRRRGVHERRYLRRSGVAGGVAKEGTDIRPEVDLVSARGKMFQELYEGDRWKSIRALQQQEEAEVEATVAGAREQLGEAWGPEAARATRRVARDEFRAEQNPEDARLLEQVDKDNLPLTARAAKSWRGTYKTVMGNYAQAAAEFDERHRTGRRRTEPTPAAEPTPEGTVVDLEKYRAERNAKTGRIQWRGPRGYVAQSAVPAERVAEEMRRVGESGGTGNVNTPPGLGGRGGGGGGGVPVRVMNFGELSRVLLGTTQTGSLRSALRSVGNDWKRIVEQAEAQGANPVDAIKGLGIPAGEAKSIVSEIKGEATPTGEAPTATTWPALKIERSAGIARTGRERGEAQIQANVQKGITAYNAAYVPPVPRGQRQEMYANLWAQADKEMDTKSARESARMQRAAEAEVRRISAPPKVAATPKPKPGPTARNIDNPEDDLLKYAARTGYRIAPNMGPADRRATAQQEIAQTYGQFNLQRQMPPERAPGVAFAQVFARLTGVKGRMEEAEKARAAAEGELLTAKELRIADQGRLEAVQKVRGALEESRTTQAAEMTAAGKGSREIATTLSVQTRYRREAIALEKNLTKQVEQRRDAEGQATERLQATDAKLASAGGKMASFAQIGALFVGAKAFMIFNQALDTTVKLAADVGARGVDQLLNFQATNDKVTKSLAQQITAFRGNTEAAMAQTAAFVGLSDVAAEFVGANVGPNALAMAGSAANMQASDLMRGAAYRATGQGPYQGFAPGLFEGTGGVLGGELFAEQMGGTPGLLERTSDDIAYFANKIANATPSATWMGALPGVPVSPPNAPAPATTSAGPGAYALNVPAGGRAGGFRTMGAMSFSGTLANSISPNGDPTALEKWRAIQTTYIADLNDAMDRGATRMGKTLDTEFTRFGDTASAVPDDIAQAMKDAGDALGGRAKESLDEILASGVGIQGLEGKDQYTQAKMVGEAMEAFAQGRVTPTEQQVLKISQAQLRVQVEGNKLMRQFQQNAVDPAQIALERIMNPPIPVATGIEQQLSVIQTEGQNKVKGGAKAVAGMNAQIVEAQRVQNQEQAYADQQAILDLIPQESQTQAKGLLDELTNVSNKIAEITARSMAMSAALAAAQYANQRRIMVRDLQDALALAGRARDTEGGRLGILQRQQVMIDRQNQALSLRAQQISIELSQLQINFQKSIAGFEAPGVTAEERAARIEQAKIEANWAQKQLDIQKEQAKLAQKSFRLNIKIFDETVSRQITDLKAALGLLDKSYVTQVSIQLNEKEIAELEKRRSRVAKSLNRLMEEGIANQNAYISTAISAAAQVSGSVNDFYITLTHMTNRYLRLVANWFTDFPNGGSSNTGGSNGPKTGNTKPGQTGATGLLGMTGGPTTMLVGEAGPEAVAVLRNPRSVSSTPMGGGGGGTTIIINVTGNSVRDDADLDVLVAKLERMLNQKASLLGFRRPS
jgi:hypothetical protein